MDDGAYWDAFPTTLTTGDVAKILSVGKPAVLTRLKSGVIPGHLIVGSWIIFKAEVRAWLESTSNQAPPGPPEPVDVLADYAEEMSYRDLMELFGKTKQTIYTWLHSGEIPAFHAGNRWIIHKPQLRRKLAETSNQKTQHDQ
ncbi:DNA-binding protein (plasmid) [Cryobacterium arcticum]|uniref:DNA-binding protein n=2 Tax=Cryobacterium arcticum TaxID=670052 RepID=A0A1B1BQC9_9MICO|nr:DNA-binding protein [Cryobacterium arcticum]